MKIFPYQQQDLKNLKIFEKAIPVPRLKTHIPKDGKPKRLQAPLIIALLIY